MMHSVSEQKSRQKLPLLLEAICRPPKINTLRTGVRYIRTLISA